MTANLAIQLSLFPFIIAVVFLAVRPINEKINSIYKQLKMQEKICENKFVKKDSI